jgi:exopolysaccharide production protein ExoQ
MTERMRPVLPALACLIFGPLIYISARGATLGMVLVALAFLLAEPRRTGAALAGAGTRLLPLVPLLVWMLASTLWAPDTGSATELALRLAGLALAGCVLLGGFSEPSPDRLRLPVLALAAGLTLCSAVVAIDLPLGGQFGRSLHPPAGETYDPALFYARAATLHAAFVIPLLLALIRLRAVPLAILHTAITVLALFETASLSAKIALAIGFGLLGLVYLVPRLRWAGLAVLAIAAVAVPAIFPIHPTEQDSCWLINHKPSAMHRILIWDFVAEHIHQHPLIGWGLDAARNLPGGKDPVVLRRCPPAPNAGTVALDSQILPLHPHNAILQIWLELGGIGALLSFGPAFLVIAGMFRRAAWRTRLTQAMLTASLGAALSIALVSFGIWQEWFLAGLFVAAGPALLAARLTPRAS